jgi:rhodanese-related sulfurtransferase
MDTNENITAVARRRALELNLPYAGALMPREAFALTRNLPGARIVDVRTRAEWDWVGRIPGAAMIEWSHYPANAINTDFLRQLETGVDRGAAALMFICRSGHRSHHAAAAATAAGYPNCFNILQGFEGDKDAGGHRNSVGGWRATGLPWEQS